MIKMQTIPTMMLAAYMTFSGLDSALSQEKTKGMVANTTNPVFFASNTENTLNNVSERTIDIKVEADTTSKKKNDDKLTIKKQPEYRKLGTINIEKDTATITKAKLDDYIMHKLVVEFDFASSNFEYSLPTFIVKGKRVSLICADAVNYVKGDEYTIKYLKFAPQERIDEERFFRDFIAKGDQSPTTLAFRPIDSSVEGIIISIENKAINPSKVEYINIGSIKVEKNPIEIKVAKLTDHPSHNFIFYFRGSMANYQYTLPTFKVNKTPISLMCDLPMSFSRNASYSIEYWKLAPGQSLTEEDFFRAFVYPGPGNYPRVAMSRTIHNSVEGIIKKIERLDDK